MISRVWHGWTTPENADAYEAPLKSEIFTEIKNRNIVGYRGIHLFRRNLAQEVEFVTIMWFDSIEAIKVLPGKTMKQLLCRRKQEPCFHDLMRVLNTTK